MKPKEYESNAIKTESTDLEPIKGRVTDRIVRLLHAGLGMSSELSELIDATVKDDGPDWVNISEENSDLAWYCAVAVNAMGFDHEEVSKFEKEADLHPEVKKHSIMALNGAVAALTCSVGDYNDLLKKHLFYGKPLNEEKLKQSLQQLCMALAGIAIISGTTIEEGRATNIAKLKARYGDKFTENAALNRDLETERKILEDGMKNDTYSSN